MSHVRRLIALIIFSAAFFIALVPGASAQVDAGNIKGTVSATTGDQNARPVLLTNARLTLVNINLPDKPVKTVTDEAGNFIFSDLPAATYRLTAEADGFPSATQEIKLASGATLNVEIVLTATVTASVNVRDEEGLLSTGETTTSNTIRSQTLNDMPLRLENYQSALLLTPGVVRTTDGVDHLKGARVGQSAYTVNGADATDPVTGALAFDIPLEAAASVQIEENPYSAEFGRLTGGATNLETKGGGDKFNVRAARFFPTFRNIISGPLDSFRPRVTLSGPVIRQRLFFLQSFEYRFTRTRVTSLAAPRDSSTLELFNSFTQLDLTINKNNRLKLVGAFSPQKVRYFGLNTFNPQEVTPNLKQRGLLFSISEQAIFNDASFLNSLVSYKTFDVNVYGQGNTPLTVLPDGNRGNYFADTNRRSRRLQWQETYFAAPFEMGGQHTLKFGAELDRTNVSALFNYRSIFIRRRDNTLAERVDFTGQGNPSRSVLEASAFAQDRWMVNKRLTFDAGLRFDHDQIARQSNFAPRLAFMFLPLKNARTIIRGGVGLFYDRIPMSVSYFASDAGALVPPFPQLPERVVTTFAADGVTILDGPRRFQHQLERPLFNPRSTRWSLQLDQGLTKNITARIGYLQRNTTDDLLIEPIIGALNTGTLRLSSRGRSRYRELQLIATYNSQRVGNWTASYTWSKARGDLNTIDNFLGDFPAFVVRPNEYGPLPFDAPNRFLAFGQLRVRYGIIISPSVEIRSGFPYSVVNERLDFVGPRNQTGRFPTFISLDVQVTKDFVIPKFVPKFRGRTLRIGAAIFNITNHFNPRDVQNNTGSPDFGKFFNSLGTSVRGKFELAF